MSTTDRTGADTATFEAELDRLDRLEVADVAADVALQRVLDRCDAWDELTVAGGRARIRTITADIRSAVAGKT